MNIKRSLLLALYALSFAHAIAQDFIVYTDNRRFYAVTIANCQVQYLSTLQLSGVSFSDITYTPDGRFWGITNDGGLYTVNPNTGVGNLVEVIPGGGSAFYTSLVADQNGIIYTAGVNGDLYTFDSNTSTIAFLGNIGFGSAGDLTFVNGQLVMASTSNQMIAIDLDNLANSQPILNFNVSGAVFGITTYVENCTNTVTYASSNSGAGNIFSVDFESGTLTPVCNIGHVIYGAASELEFLAAAPLVIESAETTPTNCADPLGSITVSVSGGNGGLVYSLDNENFQTDSTFTGLPPGEYTVYVQDTFLCTEQVTLEIAALGQAPSISSWNVQGTTCGQLNGGIELEVSGGELPYNYSMDGQNYQASNTFGGLGEGEYMAYVRDAQGCLDVLEFFVPGSEAPTMLALEADVCQVGGTSLLAAGGGGQPPLQYSLSSGGPFQDSPLFAGLASGTYEVFVQDALGCTDSAIASVGEAQPIALEALMVDTVSCLAPLASIRVQVNPTPGLVYSLDGTVFSPNPVFTDLPAGEYTVFILNDAGCSLEVPLTVEDLADGPVLTGLSIGNTRCGMANGALEITASGAQPPFTFQLGETPAQASGLYEGLAAGTYPLLVTDAQGCTAETAVAIGGSQALELMVTPLPCGPGESALQVEASGGSGSGRQYRLDGGVPQTSSLFEGLSTGSYTLFATDSDGCTAEVAAFIPEVAPLSLTLDFVRGCGPGQSSLQVSGSGGSGLLFYQLDGGPRQSAGLFEQLTAGSFSLRVVDEAGCQSEVLPVSVPGAEPLRLSIADRSPSRCNQSNGAVTLSAAGGTPPYSYTLAGQQQPSPVFEKLQAGTLPIALADAQGCTLLDSLDVAAECPVFIPSAFSPNGDGRNDRFELHSGLPFQVLSYRIYDRWGGLLYEALDFPSEDRSRFWDGQHLGRPLNTGLYVYQVEWRRADGPLQRAAGECLLAR